MITYSKKGLRVAEAYYDEPAIQSGADVLRCLNYAQPIQGANSQVFHTIHVDLSLTPEEILAQMKPSTRSDVRRAERDGVRCEATAQPDDRWLDEFFAFFEQFASGKGLPSPNRDRITGLRDAGILDLSRSLDADGNVLVWHCQYGAQARIRQLHSASLFRHTPDKDRARLISRANRYHHYCDMLRFREFTIGKAWESDFGSVLNADEFAALRAYSPLHNIKPGVAYPATLITTGDHDDRVFPAHSFKFAAALQAANPKGKPHLIRIDVRAGHGQGKPTAKQIAETADVYAFILNAFGLAKP